MNISQNDVVEVLMLVVIVCQRDHEGSGGGDELATVEQGGSDPRSGVGA